MMDFRQFLTHCDYVKDLHPEWRMGQTYFNELHNLNPSLADYIRGGEFDPFHDNKIIPHFLDMLHGYAQSFGGIVR